METPIAQLEPRPLWQSFAALNAIPRPSKKEAQVVAWLRSHVASLGLTSEVDAVGNVLVRKPATAGMEGRATVVLQSHLDMVCQQNEGTGFDFEREGIRMRVDGDWVRAEGTTLGADNGIGVAAILALLASTDIAHPALEALFTIDEETGMTGALGLQGGWLTGSILLNLDTEDDDELSIGCAGGIDVTSRGTYVSEPVAPGALRVSLAVFGGSGGHSGMDIHKGIANANKIMNRLLLVTGELFDFRIATLEGGGLRNALPRESRAVLVLDAEDREAWARAVAEAWREVAAEHALTDPGLAYSITDLPETAATGVLPEDVQEALLMAIAAVPVGIHRMSPAMPGLVQTSNNLARVTLGDGSVTLHCLTRSSVASEKHDLVRTIAAAAGLAGLATETAGGYPGWEPRPDSPIVALMREVYRGRFGAEPRVQACHAGLECGILGTNYPGLDMVSFGPNIRGAHSPDECVQISSVQKFWGYLLEVLQRIPAHHG
jgi:dipeptidase D